MFLIALEDAQRFESCLIPLMELLQLAHNEIDEESTMWHTAWLFHAIVTASIQTSVREGILVPFLRMMDVLVVGRERFTVDQLVRLNLLRYLAATCELEAHIDAELDQPPEKKELPLPVAKNLSYLDIPPLSFGAGLPQLNLENPKLQLHFHPATASQTIDYSLTRQAYLSQRKNHVIYVSTAVHSEFLMLLFGLLIDHRLHRLDTVFCDAFPDENHKLNVLFPLMRHMETPDNESTIYDLDQLLYERTASPDYRQLLRLLSPVLFVPERYAGGQHIASGSFGAVLAVTVGQNVYAVKTLNKARHSCDRPHLVPVYTEVSILAQCVGDRRVTQLVDYGCTTDSYYIVMEFYPSNLKSWRRKWRSTGDELERQILLGLYREVLQCCTILTEKRINHFDIKCDNVMLDKDGRPTLADFGEAMSYDSEENCSTQLNKGTEWIKSPEMLSIALNSAVTNPNYDRRHKVGAGPPSDVWSIGCLFFELLTGEYLFVDTDWNRFFFENH
jgi:hypothetical protein